MREASRLSSTDTQLVRITKSNFLKISGTRTCPRVRIIEDRRGAKVLATRGRFFIPSVEVDEDAEVCFVESFPLDKVARGEKKRR